MCSTQDGQKRAREPLELELEEVVLSFHYWSVKNVGY